AVGGGGDRVGDGALVVADPLERGHRLGGGGRRGLALDGDLRRVEVVEGLSVCLDAVPLLDAAGADAVGEVPVPDVVRARDREGIRDLAAVEDLKLVGGAR